jgi:protein involved in polysaccharide export with SLBB domain
MRISELIDNGKQFRENIYTKRADLFRSNDDGTKTLTPINLEEVLAGNLAADKMLQSLDSLVIYSHDHVSREKKVSISGEVKYPGEYKLYNSMKLSDLIFMAGNLTKQAYGVECELARGKRDQTIEIIAVDLEKILVQGDKQADYLLKEDDCVFVRQIPNWRPIQIVTIDGEVLFPGQYAIRHKDEKLSDLLARAGGLTNTAFPEGAIYIRNSIEDQVKQRNIEQIIINTQEARMDSMGNIIADTRVNYNPSQLNRIVIDLPDVLDNPGNPNDIVLADSDYVYIPTYPSGVQVIGAVAYNGTISYIKNKKADYYLGQAGGLAPDGEKSRIRLVRPNGKVYYGGKAQSRKVELGDAIIVPSKIKQKRDWGRILSTTATIVGSVATTIFVVDRLK